MKILLTTIYDCRNLGNRLQHIALQTVLENYGHEVFNLVYKKKYDEAIWKKTIKSALGLIGVEKYKSYHMRELVSEIQRTKRLQKHSRRSIHNAIKVSFNSVFKRDWDEIEYGVTGSDQVWHNWKEQRRKWNRDLEYFYLMFLPEEKRISYAPSFGFEEFPEEDIELHKKGLSEMKSLSCREKDGAELILKLVKKEAEIVLDPTLLLEETQWVSFAKKPRWKVPHNYVLLYFLGEITNEYRNLIDKYVIELSKKMNDNSDIVVINLLDKNQCYFYSTPDEFLYLLMNARMVLTDSFHAVVFSIIFHRNFLAFQRVGEGMERMFGRIEGLLNMCNIKDHIYSPRNNTMPNMPDYLEVDSTIEYQRKKSLYWLEGQF